jgi:hypothetical protein
MAVLMSLFSFVIVIYLMNLFIGLLNMAIQEDNNRASYLAQKAEVSKIKIYVMLLISILLFFITIYYFYRF